jgi:cold shock CspA family protein
VLGHISFYNNRKGYGFISVIRIENGAKIVEQYFFHHSNFKDGETPALNGIVVFSLGNPIAAGKKMQAVAVRYATPHEITEANKQIADAKVAKLTPAAAVLALLSGKGGAA